MSDQALLLLVQSQNFLLLQIDQSRELLRLTHILLVELHLEIIRQLVDLLLQVDHCRFLNQYRVGLILAWPQGIQKLLQSCVE